MQIQGCKSWQFGSIAKICAVFFAFCIFSSFALSASTNCIVPIIKAEKQDYTKGTGDQIRIIMDFNGNGMMPTPSYALYRAQEIYEPVLIQSASITLVSNHAQVIYTAAASSLESGLYNYFVTVTPLCEDRQGIGSALIVIAEKKQSIGESAPLVAAIIAFIVIGIARSQK